MDAAAAGCSRARAHLIGVCNAADPTDDEGIYAAIETIHWQIDKIGLSGIYQQATPETPAAEHLTVHETAGNLPVSSPAASSLPAQNDNVEVICIVRSKNNPSAKKQVIVIERATADLLNKLAEGASDPTAAADLLQADRRNASPVSTSGTQLRGQSRR